MAHGGAATAMQLQGDPAFWDHMSGPGLLGMSPAAGSKAG